PGLPVGDTVDESFQRRFGTLLTGHFMQVPFKGDSIAAIHDGSYEIRADNLLVQLLPAPADVGVKRFVFESIVAPHLSKGFGEHSILFTFLLHATQTLGSQLAPPRNRSIDDELIDDDPVEKGSPRVNAGPEVRVLIRRFCLGVDPDFRDELLSLPM